MNFNFNFRPPEKLLSALSSQKTVKFIGFLFMTIGICMTFWAVKIFLDEKDAQDWVPHTANIQRAEIRTHIDDDNGFKSYSVGVAYQYQWKNVLFQGDKYRLHYNSSSGFDENNKIVQDLLYAMEQGEDYPIFVNPKNPENSAVKNIVDGETKLVVTIFGIVFPIVGFFMFFFSNLFNRR